MSQIGYFTGKIILIIFPLLIIKLIGTNDRKQSIKVWLFIAGWILYVLPMELRPLFLGNHFVLFWLGIIPNFGCAFALPIIGLRNKNMSYSESINKLHLYSLYTLILLLCYELVELIKGFGTFDWLDLLMSICGLVATNLIFGHILRHK